MDMVRVRVASCLVCCLVLMMIYVSSNFWPSPSFRAKIPKLVRISGDRHLGAHLQCEQRAIAVCKWFQPPSPPPLIRRRSAIAKTCYFSFVVSDVVST